MNYETRITIARDWVANLIARYERPAHLAHDKAKLELADMAEDANATIPARLTPEQFRSTLDKAARTIRAKNRTRSWPTIALVCQAIRENLPPPETHDQANNAPASLNPDKSLTINANRIKQGLPVSDSYLWGRLAHELLKATDITQDQINSYRNAHRQNLTAIYGPEKTQHILEDLSQRHQDANPKLNPATQWQPDLASKLDDLAW